MFKRVHIVASQEYYFYFYYYYESTLRVISSYDMNMVKLGYESVEPVQGNAIHRDV